MVYLLLLAGLIILAISGELLVKGAVGVALRYRISTLVVGMTVVSFGTSAPELLVSLVAALSGSPDIAIGNVIGSNIANIALVMGVTALIFPLVVSRNSVRIDWPAMMIATLLFYLTILDGNLDQWEGMCFVAMLIIFLVWLVRRSRKEYLEPGSNKEAVTGKNSSLGRDIAFTALGCVGLVFGADWLVDAAVDIAQSFGVSERVIGITVVAFGTSVPELATSCMAAFRKQVDISVGNLIGSNLFNIMAVLGITASITPVSIHEKVLNFDMFWMVGVAAILLPLMYFGYKLTRAKGLLLLAVYIMYIYFLF